MKKEIVCPVCGGRGYVSWIQSTETSCSSGSKTCPHCNGTGWVEVDLTNADHIRSMTDEELAEFLCGVYDEDEDCAKFINGIVIPAYSEQDIEDWLKQPYKEDT